MLGGIWGSLLKRRGDDSMEAWDWVDNSIVKH